MNKGKRHSPNGLCHILRKNCPLEYTPKAGAIFATFFRSAAPELHRRPAASLGAAQVFTPSLWRICRTRPAHSPICIRCERRTENVPASQTAGTFYLHYTSTQTPGLAMALLPASMMPIMATVSSCAALISPVRKKSHIALMKFGKELLIAGRTAVLPSA